MPAAFAATAIYGLPFNWAVRRYPRLKPTFRFATRLVLVLFLCELSMILVFGAVRSQNIVGPVFPPLCATVFFLATPALANLFFLRSDGPPKWYIAALICSMFALVLLLLQVAVSEQLS